MLATYTQYSGSLADFPSWQHAWVAFAGPVITFVCLLCGCCWALLRPGPYSIATALVNSSRSMMMCSAFVFGVLFMKPTHEPEPPTVNAADFQRIDDPTDHLHCNCDETAAAVLFGLPEPSLILPGCALTLASITFLLRRRRDDWTWRQLTVMCVGAVAGFCAYAFAIFPFVEACSGT
jgi:cytochrome bd-type quinol oxidase subunit 2